MSLSSGSYLDSVDQARAKLEQARLSFAQANVDRVTASRALQLAERLRSNDSSTVQGAQRNEFGATEAVNKAQAALAAARQDLKQAMAAGLSNDPTQDLSRLSTDYPVLFLPIRLETRFKESVQNGKELWIRIYPDEIYGSGHEKALTPKEVVLGSRYWTKAWEAVQTAASFTSESWAVAQKDAWRWIVAQMSAQRAAWVVRQMTPANWDEARQPGANESPALPTPPGKQESWSQPIEAHLLPERFIIIATMKSGRRVVVFSETLVPEPLALTVDPHQPGDFKLLDSGFSVSTQAAWSFDFEVARQSGLAVRIQLEEQDWNDGVERIIAFGVKLTLPAVAAAQQLEELIEAHHYVRGLAFVDQGSPTNNTSVVKSLYPLEDPGGNNSFRIERAQPLIGELDNGAPASNGIVVAGALGIQSAVFAHIGGAEVRELDAARQMNHALWPATWGYYLEQLLDPVFDDNQIAAAKQYFIQWVNGRGHLPCFRIGAVPYGILPVSSLSLWRTDSGEEDSLAMALPENLSKFKQLWLSKLDQVPRVGGSTDPDAELLQVLGMEGAPQEVWMRSAYGPDSYQNLQDFVGVDGQGLAFQNQMDARGDPPLRAIGHAEWQPLLRAFTYCQFAMTLELPWVLGKTDESKEDQDYIQWIMQASIPELQQELFKAPLGGRPAALLYHLLRHAMLLEYRRAGYNVLIEQGVAQPSEKKEPEMVQMIPGTETQSTLWQRMNEIVPGTNQTLGAYLTGGKRTSSHVLELDAYKNSLRFLAGLKSYELETLLRESLGLCSYRLDSWISSLPARRLTQMRQREGQQQGIYLGAYGWVENLKRGTSDAAKHLGGFIHAPSMDHAAAGAILRNAFLSQSGDGPRRYSMSLTSASVRKANFLLDAMRAGQELSQVLGYLFEKDFQEQARKETNLVTRRDMALWLESLKAMFLLYSRSDINSQPVESIGPRNVIDGLKLLDAWRNSTIPFTGEANLKGAEAVVNAAIQKLSEAFDALLDMLTAESVYQVVKGRPMSAAASLDTIGQALRPTDPEVIQQPRDGLTITHRVGVIVGTPALTPPAAWQSDFSPMADAEPSLNGWVGSILGDPAKIICWVTYLKDPKDPHARVELATPVQVNQLNLQPLDFLALAAQQSTSSESGQSDLDRKILETASDKLPSGAAAVQIVFAKDPNEVPSGSQTLYEALEKARAIQAVIGSARPLAPSDLLALDAGLADKTTTDDMEKEFGGRATSAMTALTTEQGKLAGEIAKLRNSIQANQVYDLKDLRVFLNRASRLGIPGAVPFSFSGADPLTTADLLTQADVINQEMKRRIDQAGVVGISAQDRLKAIFGRGFLGLPIFTLKGDNVAEISQALANGPKQIQLDAQKPDAFVMKKWFQKSSRTRSHLEPLRTLGMIGEAAGVLSLELELAQLPAHVDERWVALPFDPNKGPPDASRISIALYRPVSSAPDQGWCGLLIDEWSELIPNVEEKTGISFNFENPGAEAPQTLLLAIPPDRAQGHWNLDAFEKIFSETWDLLQLRAIDPDLISQELSQILPAIYLADNTAGDTVCTNLAEYRIKKIKVDSSA